MSDEPKELGDALARVLVVDPLGLARCGGPRRAPLAHQLDRELIEA